MGPGGEALLRADGPQAADLRSSQARRHLVCTSTAPAILHGRIHLRPARHVVGAENVVADCLSMPPTALSLGGSTKVADVNVPFGLLAATVARDRSAWGLEAAVEPSPSVDMSLLAQEQRSCVETTALRAKMRTRDVLVGGAAVWCDISIEQPRPLVPVHKLWHVHVDLVGQWAASSGGHRHLLTVVDRTSRWAEAIPMRFKFEKLSAEMQHNFYP